MKAEELRIGNLILYKGKMIPVTMVGIFGIQSETEESIINAKFSTGDLKPIPLSEDLLLKCGAVLQGIGYIIKASALSIKIRFHSGIAYCEFGNVYLGDRVKYLHELQNLKYALCGVELEVSI